MIKNKAEVIKELLEESFWLESLNSKELYSRLHDDHDGMFKGRINVSFSPDGDAWISFEPGHSFALRFRMSMVGGGRSPRVRNALMILAEAIRLDNLERPDPEPTKES